MNLKTIFTIIIVFICYACVSQKNIEPEKISNGDLLFSKAEYYYKKKSYLKALNTYIKFHTQFPFSPLAAAAIMKIGDIHLKQNKPVIARTNYKKVIAKYPNHFLVPDAKANILFTFFKEGRYDKVISNALLLIDKTASTNYILKVKAILGDAYMASRFFTDAAYYYLSVYHLLNNYEKKKIIVKINNVFKQLDKSEIKLLLERFEDIQIKGNVLYLFGKNKVINEQYDDAFNVLSDFIEKYPNDINVKSAEDMLEKIEDMSVFDHYSIGCLLPLSGQYQYIGKKALKGIELAMINFSAQNQTNSIKIIIQDTGSDPDKAVLSAIQLFDRHVAAIIGPIVTSDVVAKESQKAKVPLITLTQKENITRVGDYVFRNFITPEMQVKSIVSFANNVLGIEKFAVLYPKENYGTTYMNLFWDEVIKHDGEIVGVESYNAHQTDYSIPIKKLIGLYYRIAQKKQTTQEELPDPIIDFEALFIPDSPKKAELILPQLVYYDIENVYLFGTNLWHSEKLVNMSQRYMRGVVMPDGFFAQKKSKKVKAFVKLFRQTYDETPEFIEAIAYDTAMLLFQILTKSDIQSRNDIKNELLNLTHYDGLTGLISFDETGDAQKKLYLLRIKGKKFVEIKQP